MLGKRGNTRIAIIGVAIAKNTPITASEIDFYKPTETNNVGLNRLQRWTCQLPHPSLNQALITSFRSLMNRLQRWTRYQ